MKKRSALCIACILLLAISAALGEEINSIDDLPYMTKGRPQMELQNMTVTVEDGVYSATPPSKKNEYDHVSLYVELRASKSFYDLEWNKKAKAYTLDMEEAGLEERFLVACTLSCHKELKKDKKIDENISSRSFSAYFSASGEALSVVYTLSLWDPESRDTTFFTLIHDADGTWSYSDGRGGGVFLDADGVPAKRTIRNMDDGYEESIPETLEALFEKLGIADDLMERMDNMPPATFVPPQIELLKEPRLRVFADEYDGVSLSIYYGAEPQEGATIASLWSIPYDEKEKAYVKKIKQREIDFFRERVEPVTPGVGSVFYEATLLADSFGSTLSLRCHYDADAFLAYFDHGGEPPAESYTVFYEHRNARQEVDLYLEKMQDGTYQGLLLHTLADYIDRTYIRYDKDGQLLESSSDWRKIRKVFE